jgi:hypothetical protein
MQQNQVQVDELEETRREVERLPILAPKGNLLLGRWQRAATTAPAPKDLYDSLMQLGNDVACTFISGDGPDFEFRTDALVHGAQTVDTMRYYGGQDGVVLALGERYRPPLAFKFDGPNRAILGSCAFERVGVIATDPAPASAKTSPAPTIAAKNAASGAFSIVNVQLGVDSLASVERDIASRGGTPSSGRGGLGNPFRLSTLSGNYRDFGTSVEAVYYDFDAPGPTGKLIAVTIVSHANNGPEYDKLLAERKTAASTSVGTMQQKSAAEYLAVAPSCQLRFFTNPSTWFIWETYKLPK